MKIQYIQYNSNNFKKVKKRKKHSFIRILITILIILIILAIAGYMVLGNMYTFDKLNNKIYSTVNTVISKIVNKASLTFKDIKGENDIYLGINKDNSTEYYFIDGIWYKDQDFNSLTVSNNNDVKTIIEYDNKQRLVNYPDGYLVDFQNILDYDFSLSPDYIVGYKDNYSVTLSIEHSPYDDVTWYINHYQNRFYLSEEYRNENNITLVNNETKEINGKQTIILTLTRNTDSNEYPYKTYTYAYILLHDKTYARFMFKTDAYSEEYINNCIATLNSFKEISKKYTANYHMEFEPTINPNWGPKTVELYNQYLNSNEIDFGIFSGNDGIYSSIPNIESKLENDFDIVLIYNHFGNTLDLDTIDEITYDNKAVELTVQTCVNNNEKLFGYTPIFDIIDGKKDDEIRELAFELTCCNCPILFRLNNEMNSDWTSYSGIIGLSDPEVYKTVWKRIYNIFQEEGVKNCIWIYNPNDNNYPPNKWNNFLAYYPGNEYVQMIGVTGYNTGTYYAEQNAEKWKEFKDIYDEIQVKYESHFSKFPWIITEFASSSVGGDKAKWIENMFNNISNYPNIKAAVWFNSADYNPENGEVSRPYWLTETDETLNAFKNGLKKLK